MKRISTLLFVLCVVLIAASMPMLVVSAAAHIAPVAQEATPPPSLDDLLKTLSTLTGVSMFITVLINGLKKFDLLPDGKAPAASLIMNAVALVALVVLQTFGVFDIVPVIDKNAGILAQVLAGIIALGYQLWATRKAHTQVFAGMPLVGTSYSNRQAGDDVMAELTVTGAHYVAPNIDVVIPPGQE